ncbi:MAG: methylenetetrahydromethanopterin dehydrogenase, partial [Methylococcales bacterium]
KNILALGGTGPVGQAAAVISAKAGAHVRIIGRQKDKAERIAAMCNVEFGNNETGITGGADADKEQYLETTDIVYATAAAGVEVLSAKMLAQAPNLKVVADVNAVPPSGIAGLHAHHDGQAIEGSRSGAVGIGALAIGNVKYHAQNRLLKRMIEEEKPVYLHFEHAFDVAREYVRR